MDFTKAEMENTKAEMDLTKTEIIIGNNYKPITKPIAKTITKPIAGETPLPPLPDFIDPELWEQYLAYKKERKEKLSMQGVQMKFLQWGKWASEGIDVNACIREAMANEWQGVFKPKGALSNTSLEDFANQHGLDLDLAQKVKTNQMHLNQAKTQMAVRKFCADEHAIEAEIL